MPVAVFSIYFRAISCTYLFEIHHRDLEKNVYKGVLELFLKAKANQRRTVVMALTCIDNIVTSRVLRLAGGCKW